MAIDEVALATTLASLGAICWSVQIIPQIILNHKRRSTEGLAGPLMLIWCVAGVPLGIYNVTRHLNLGLQVQPQSFMVFAAVCYVQTFMYRLRWTYGRAILTVLGLLSVFAAVEAMGILLIFRVAEPRGQDDKAEVAVGVVSALLINVGLVPQFYEIYKLKAVVGVSYTFLAIDTAGAVFSLLSLLFNNGGHFDILAGVSYGLLVLEEGLVFALGLAFWLRERQRVKRGSGGGGGGDSESTAGLSDGCRQMSLGSSQSHTTACVDRNDDRDDTDVGGQLSEKQNARHEVSARGASDVAVHPDGRGQCSGEQLSPRLGAVRTTADRHVLLSSLPTLDE